MHNSYEQLPFKGDFRDNPKLTKFQELEKKVLVLCDFQDKLDSFSLQDAPEEVANQLNNTFQEIKKQFSSNTLSLFERFIQCDNQLDFLIQKEEEIDNKMYLLLKERENIFQDNEVRFLFFFETVIKDLIEKNRQIHQIIQGEKDMIDDFASLNIDFENEEKFNAEKILEKKIEPFSITLILDADYADSIRDFSDGTVVGMHVVHSPYNLIKNIRNKALMKETERHEKMHNLLDEYLLPIGPSTSEAIQNIIEHFKDEYQSISIDGLFKDSKYRQELEHKCNPRLVLYRLHGEILSDLENAKVNGFDGFKIDKLKQDPYESAFNNYFQKALGRDNRQWINFSSTSEIMSIKSLLHREIKNTSNQEVKDFLNSLLKDLQNEFVMAISSMRFFLKIAKFLGDQVVSEVSALFVILHPIQYKTEIENYLKLKFGQEKIEFYLERVQAIDNGEISVKLIKFILKIRESLSDTDKDKLRDNFESFSLAEIDLGQIFGIQDWKNLADFRRLISEYGDLLNLELWVQASFYNGVEYYFFAQLIEKQLLYNLALIVDLYNNLSEEQKQGTFKDALSEFLDDKEGQEDLSSIKSNSDFKKIIRELDI